MGLEAGGVNNLSVPGTLDTGAVTTGETEITNATNIQSDLSADNTGLSTDVWYDIADVEEKDVRDEQDSNFQINVDVTGEYLIIARVFVFDCSDQDFINLAVRDVDSGSTLDFGESRVSTSGAEDVVELTTDVELTAGTNYKIQIKNQSSGFSISGGNPTSGYVVKKSPVQ